MPYDSTGTFSRLHSWEQDRLNNIDIASDRHDEEDDNFAQGLTNCVCKDGRSIMSGNLNMGGYRVSNVANAAAANDAVNKSQLEGTASTLSSELIQAIKVYLDAKICIGDIKASLASENHDGWILCNGQEISRTTYADLFNLIGTQFGSGDEYTTFNVPDYRGKFLRGLGGNSAADIYTTQAEGLPNITGKANFVRSEGHPMVQDPDGAFYDSGTSGSYEGSDAYATDTADVLNFDASRANTIYGASNHVTPINQAVNYFILAQKTE